LATAINTLVLFTSGNGPWCQTAYSDSKKGHPEGSIFWGSPGELRGGKGSAYEGGSRGPCIVRWPGKVPAGRTSDALFTTLDVLPTLASLCGFKAPTDRPIDGVDQVDLLLGKSDTGARKTYIHDHSAGEGVGIRDAKWKYLQPARAPKKKHRFLMDFGTDGVELYDLSKDPSETTNLAAPHPEVVDRQAGHDGLLDLVAPEGSKNFNQWPVFVPGIDKKAVSHHLLKKFGVVLVSQDM